MVPQNITKIELQEASSGSSYPLTFVIFCSIKTVIFSAVKINIRSKAVITQAKSPIGRVKTFAPSVKSGCRKIRDGLKQKHK